MSAEKKQKPPWAFPECSPEIDRIIEKVDARQKLTPAETKALRKFEESHGGFGGFGAMIEPSKKI